MDKYPLIEKRIGLVYNYPMKYAVIEASGSQMVVEEGKPILVDHVDQEAGQKIEFDRVLLAVDGDQVTIGKPVVAGGRVIGEIVKHEKGDKIRVVNFRAKSRYRKARGYRHSYTHVLIKTIELGKARKEA